MPPHRTGRSTQSVIGAQLVMALQTVVSRNVDPVESAW